MGFRSWLVKTGLFVFLVSAELTYKDQFAMALFGTTTLNVSQIVELAAIFVLPISIFAWWLTRHMDSEE